MELKKKLLNDVIEVPFMLLQCVYNMIGTISAAEMIISWWCGEQRMCKKVIDFVQ